MSQNKKTDKKSSRKTSRKTEKKKTSNKKTSNKKTSNKKTSNKKTSNKKTSNKKTSRKTSNKKTSRTEKKSLKNMKGGGCIINPIKFYYVNEFEPCPFNNGEHINTQNCRDYRTNNSNNNYSQGTDKNCDLCGFVLDKDRNILKCNGSVNDNPNYNLWQSMNTAIHTHTGIRNHVYKEMTKSSPRLIERQLDTLFDKLTGKNITLHYCIFCHYILPPEYVKNK